MSSAPTASPQPPPGGPPVAPRTSSGAKIILWIVGIIGGFIVLGVVGVSLTLFYFVHKAKQAGFDPELMKKNPVLVVAKLTIAANPDQELVSSDDSSGVIVVREKKTGKVLRMQVDADKKIMTITDDTGKTVTMKLDPQGRRLVMTDDQGKTASITADDRNGHLEIKSSEGTMKIGAGADKAPDWVPVYPGSNPQNTFSASDDKSATGTYVFVTRDSVDKVLGYYGDTLKAAGFKTSNTVSNSDGKIAGIVSATSDGDKQTVLVTAGDDNDGTKVSVTFNNKK